MPKSPIVSVIILNFLGEKSLPDTIDSLLNQDFSRSNFEIIIVDNNSTDNSRTIINKYAKDYPELIKTIFNYRNHGFAKGNNQAIRVSKSKFICLLNNDCIVEKNWLTVMVNSINSLPNTFSFGSKIKRYPPEVNLIQNAGSIIFYDGYTKDIGAIVSREHQQSYEADIGQYQKQVEVYSTCGAAVIYSRTILDQIGLLDENFFMYYEDLEICERAQLSGYSSYYCPTAVAYHHHAQSSQEWSSFFVFHTETGRLLHIFYHFPLAIFFNELFKFKIKTFFRTIYFIPKKSKFKKSLVYWNVIFQFIKNFPKYLHRRQSFSKLYSPSARLQNFDKILSGHWYFHNTL
jgi:GT2 family glycosyltransferase